MTDTVTVLFFAALREQVGHAKTDQRIGNDATVAELRTTLCNRGEPWQSALTDPVRAIAAVNQDYADETQRIQPGDEIAFFPPVTGG